MCGRYTLTLDRTDIEREYGLSDMPADWQQRFNIAPTQSILAISDRNLRKPEWMFWGLIPFWSAESPASKPLINARAETIQMKPAFRRSFYRQRCLILADGFYEWRKPASGRGASKPFYFCMADRKPFFFAGIWSGSRGESASELPNCALITCEPNACVAPVHARMPVIFDLQHGWSWLEEKTADDLQAMLTPFPADLMRCFSVSQLVNDAGQDLEKCIEPVTDQ